MSFQKLNLCVSVQRAFDVFYMLRTDTANMVRKDLSDTTDDLVKYKVGEYTNHALKLRGVAELISTNYNIFHEIRIHDIKQGEGQRDGESTETRVVEFHLRNAYGSTATVIVVLTRMWCEEGLTDWVLHGVHVDTPTTSKMMAVKQEKGVLPSRQMRAIAGDGLLVFV